MLWFTCIDWTKRDLILSLIYTYRFRMASECIVKETLTEIKTGHPQTRNALQLNSKWESVQVNLDFRFGLVDGGKDRETEQKKSDFGSIVLF